MLLMVPSSCQAWPPPAWGQQKYTAPPMPSGKGMEPGQIIYISLCYQFLSVLCILVPVRNTTKWLTESASGISETTLVGEICSQVVETSLPATISPNMAILPCQHRTSPSLYLASVSSLVLRGQMGGGIGQSEINVVF